jgi:hypothetical protein
MSNDIDTDLILPDEMTTLKSRADLLGITYHPSIGLEKLREKVNGVVVAKDGANHEVILKPEKDSLSTEIAVESDGQFHARKRREANELIRVNITCMNPAKAEWDGEIFTSGNSLVGSFKKYVPFNADEGWHIPRIIYNQIKERECQIFVAHKDARGNTIRKGKMIKEFSIEVLPNLTPDELDELARRQAASKAID